MIRYTSFIWQYYMAALGCGAPNTAHPMRLLQTLLQQATFNESVRGGCSNDLVWRSWQKNLLKAQADLPAPIPAHLARLTAAYMTLGTRDHCGAIASLLMVHYSVTLSATGYDTQGARYFDKNGDVDNDGVWNPEEWKAALAAQEEPYVGVIYAATVNAFVQMAMDASIPETPESNGSYIYHGATIYDENGNVYIAADDVIQLGSAKHLAVLAEATGANSAYIPTTTLTIGSTTGTDLKFDANVVDPPGFENVPLTKNQAFTCAKGRQIRVTMKGTEREKKWFKMWNAQGTLVNGTPSRSMVFRLGNDQQVITPVKRSVGSIGLDSRLSWSAKGYQPEEAHTGTVGSTNILYAPEDTYVTLSYNASSGSGAKSGAGETCKHVGWGVTGHDMSVDSQGLISTGSLQMDPSSGWAVMPSVSCCVNEPPDPADYSDNSEYLNDLSWYEACWDNLTNGSTAHSWSHTFKGDDGCTVLGAPIEKDSDYGEIAGLTPGGTMDAAPYSPNNVNFTDMVYYSVKLKPGYQLGSIEYFGTTASASSAGSIPVSYTTGPVSAKISTEEMMTLDADVKVKDDEFPAATAGTITGSILSPDGSNTIGGLRGYCTRISDSDPRYADTELIALNVQPFTGAVLKRWSGTGSVYNSDGTPRTDVALDAGDDEPDRWVTDQTIYVKCATFSATKGNSSVKSVSASPKAILDATSVDISLYAEKESFKSYADRTTPENEHLFLSGQDFCAALRDVCEEKCVKIGHLYVFSHAWGPNSLSGRAHDGGVWSVDGNNSGFYGKIILQKTFLEGFWIPRDSSDAWSIDTLKIYTDDKRVRFDSKKKTFFEGCRVAAIGNFAERFAGISGRKVVAALGASTDIVNPLGPPNKIHFRSQDGSGTEFGWVGVEGTDKKWCYIPFDN